MSPRIDSHQHFWRYSPATHDWITDEMAVLRRDYLPADLRPLLQAGGIDGCIAVQAAQSLDETRFLLGLADAHPWIRGVVGWVDLRSPDVAAQLREFAGHPAFVGVRHIVQSEPDPRFVLGPEFVRGIAALAEFDLVYDLLVFPHQLPAAVELVARFPQQRFVLDHLAKPRIAKGERAEWERDLRALARCGNVACKVSGMVTEADWQAWRPDGLRVYWEVALDAFGPGRLLYGSDWPVCRLAAEYGRWLEVVEGWVETLGPEDRVAVMGGNAGRVYQAG